MWMMWIVGGVVCLTVGGAVGAFAFSQRKHACPQCGERALRLVATRSSVSTDEGMAVERMYRCGACNAELMRRGKGALIPKAAWDRGERAELPPARLLDR